MTAKKPVFVELKTNDGYVIKTKNSLTRNKIVENFVEREWSTDYYALERDYFASVNAEVTGAYTTITLTLRDNVDRGLFLDAYEKIRLQENAKLMFEAIRKTCADVRKTSDKNEIVRRMEHLYDVALDLL